MMIFGSWLFFATVLSTSACFFHRSIIISLSVQGEGFYPNIANHMYVKYIYKSVAVLVLVTQLKRLIISCTRKTIAYPEYVVSKESLLQRSKFANIIFLENLDFQRNTRLPIPCRDFFVNKDCTGRLLENQSV